MLNKVSSVSRAYVIHHHSTLVTGHLFVRDMRIGASLQKSTTWWVISAEYRRVNSCGRLSHSVESDWRLPWVVFLPIHGKTEILSRSPKREGSDHSGRLDSRNLRYPVE